MSRYIFGRKSWRDPSSKYGLEPAKFESDVQQNVKRYEMKKNEIYDTLNGFMRDDPYNQEETFRVIIEWARDWKMRDER